MNGILNIIWLVFAGIWLALAYALAGLVMCITIIGIPLALANLKLIPITLTPFGREIVSNDRIQIVPVTGPPDTRH